MRITKKSYEELKVFYDGAVRFLSDLKCDAAGQMLIAECCTEEGGPVCLSFFDSKSGKISKAELGGKEPDGSGIVRILEFFKLDAERAVIESYTSSYGDSGGGKKQLFYVIFDFKDKVTGLLYDFLKLYQQYILQHLRSRAAVAAEEVLDVMQELLHEVIKRHIDLDIITTLSGSQYEKRDSSGSLVYIKNPRDADCKIKFAKEIDFSIDNLRLLRKLLEMSDSKLSLLVHQKKVIGLGTRNTDYRKVQFSGHQKWALQLGQKEILRFSRGRFFFDRGDNRLFQNMPKGFILKKYEKHFNTIISILTKQKHGALLIITDSAGQEVERLSGLARGYAVAPIDFTDAENLWLIKSLSSIDGAVFIDRQLKCYGAGIILDGIAKRYGSTARGARYNSACCYLDNRTDAAYAAVVFSEDETTDVIFSK